MTRTEKLLLLLGGAGLLYFVTRSQSAPTDFLSAPISSVKEAVVSTIEGWQNVGQGPVWVPALNATEQQMGIPTNLLARIAYEESHFRQDIIDGTKVSSAGALGMMQLMPAYFASVRVPIPFTQADTLKQIAEAAQDLVSAFESTGDWSLALAAYNAGLGNVRKYNGIPPFPETQKYVSDILADVPGAAPGAASA